MDPVSILSPTFAFVIHFVGNQLGRAIFTDRHPERSILLLTTVSSFILLALPVPALLISCDTPGRNSDICPGSDKDSTSDLRLEQTTFIINGASRKADIFICPDADGIISEHLTTESDTITVLLPDGDYRVAAVSDSPFGFNDLALKHYESIELITFRLEDEVPGLPVGSATAHFHSGDTASLDCTPLICRIRLAKVTNNIPGYTRLKDPRIHLEDINKEAELFRSNGFRPEIGGLSGDTVRLDSDIGMFPSYPDKTLFCYPDDGATQSAAVPGTTFVFECETDSTEIDFRIKLAPLRRGSVTDLNLTVNSADDGRWEVFQRQ